MKKVLSGSLTILFFHLCLNISGRAENAFPIPDSEALSSVLAEAPSLGECKTYSSDSLGVHHRICYDSVCVLIRNFIETFNDDAKNNGLGGYIDASNLKTPPHSPENYKGWLFYNGCYSTTFKKEFFLAYVYDSISSPDSVPCTIIDEYYYYHSSSPFLFPDSTATLEGISGFLSNMPKPEGPMNSFIPGKDLDTACQIFSNYFVSSGSPTNESHCGFFLGKEINEILSQSNCVGLRFFFGYEPDRKANKIRIIFIGVDNNGDNILLNDEGKEAIFFESEWPPSVD